LVWVYVGGYVGAIFAANWAVSTIGLLPVGFGLTAPAGVYFVGLTFTLRDLVQEHWGRCGVLVAIILGAAISASLSGRLAVASGAAFLLSELADFGVYTPLRERNWPLALVASNAIGLAVDSALFLQLAFGSLDFLSGQIVGKAWMTLLALLVLYPMRRRREVLPWHA
jgi:hypothetical protein